MSQRLSGIEFKKVESYLHFRFTSKNIKKSVFNTGSEIAPCIFLQNQKIFWQL